MTRAQRTAKPRKTDSIRNCIEQGIIPPAPVRLAGNVRAWPVAEANAIIVAASGERILSKPRRPISETNFSLLAWEGRTAQQMWGDGEAEAKYDIRVNYDLCGKRLRTGSRRGECGQTPECRREYRRPPARCTDSAGLRPLRLAVRLLRFEGRGGGSAHREKLFGPDAGTCGMYRWLRDNGFPGGFQILCLSCNDSKGTGERCTLAHVDGKKRCCACNEIKLPVKEFGTDRTARDGHARGARCATPQPEQ